MKASELFSVQQYLLRAVSRPSFWSGIDYQTKNDAIACLHQLPDEFAAWQDWIAVHLNDEQKQKLNSSIRKARMRDKGKNITVSKQAHQMLTLLSDGGRLTLSEVIEHNLRRAYQKRLKSADNKDGG
ncbi:hypothetical protein [Planctobacterium marinum]|uniref:Uncharacterized protein n=1 Tax=Planctobacterium marinum TaxID=1631968 RepID=A0AA48HJV8_9ALTE|nr:hypothetical protein MACH26_21150 [Planctobacterium marinum]